ncbi:hypothetical protein [Desulfosporosinus nitroreducens]|uniref:hypothetical protein n=1 Tax=Desulfosporosinus nitroreducens TaxID=2018668 RepID=UPI00207D1354|nr:hypothetical protein [Desulfosporosinus nitroreducens]MCO1600278.1 hypothetical protein [Desulfosporosinus nitroreducens]
MKKKLRTIFAWVLVSLFLQFGAYSFLENKVAKVLGPVAEAGPITKQLEATIPGTDFENVQVSYAKDYLAYTENGTLKIFNLKKEKMVFEKKAPANDNTMGVLNYQWLPDRDTLVYFYGKKNPNPVTYVTVPVDPVVPPATTPPKSTVPINPEDPNQKPNKQVEEEVKPKVPVQTKTVPKYGNPQITELYTLELPNSDEDTAPDDRFNQTINEFPAGGKIEEFVVSTSTNLIYLTIKNGSTERLMEIDVMKNVRTLNKTGETIDSMAASDRYGTLFITSKVGGTKQVISLGVGNRHTISKNANDRVIGVLDGKVYIGEVKNNVLVKIKSTEDRSEIKDNPSFQTEWEGSIPFNNVSTLIGSEGQIVIYSQQMANVITAGQLEEIPLLGEENYISDDGAELIQMKKSGTSTIVELKPLKD